MNLSKRTIVLFFFALFGLGLYFGDVLKKGEVEIEQTSSSKVVFGEFEFEAIVVDTFPSRAQGLSGRPSLEDRSGMLFIFEEPGIYGFWMKDMLFSLDMIWIDEDWRVIDISKNVHPDTYPQSFSPMSPAQYIFEVNAGVTDKIGLQLGQQVEFIR